MEFYLLIKQAFWSIVANKLRSVLSTLWIIIGISSFVIMLSVWEAAKQSILQDFSTNSQLITVNKKSGDNIAKDIFTAEIAQEITSIVPSIEQTFISYWSPDLDITVHDKRVDWMLNIITEGYLEYEKAIIDKGAYFNSDVFTQSKKVVILWYESAKYSFKNTNPIWEYLFIGGEKFLITGVLKKKNGNLNYSIFIPNTTAKNTLNQDTISSIQVYIEDVNAINITKNRLNYFLFKKSAVPDVSKVAFSLRTSSDAIEQINKFTRKFTFLLWGIWAIALIVWGIWIMNIMLVSVTERTREIGIRKAIWATNKNILMQFLTESIILTFIGTFFAILLSYWVTKCISYLVAEMQVSINFSILGISIIVSLLMGIVFWLMPAYKAAKLKPIDALHFE